MSLFTDIDAVPVYTTKCPLCGAEDTLRIVKVDIKGTLKLDVPLTMNGHEAERVALDELCSHLYRYLCDGRVYCSNCKETFALSHLITGWEVRLDATV